MLTILSIHKYHPPETEKKKQLSEIHFQNSDPTILRTTSRHHGDLLALNILYQIASYMSIIILLLDSVTKI
jgi:hypothetical protein